MFPVFLFASYIRLLLSNPNLTIILSYCDAIILSTPGPCCPLQRSSGGETSGVKLRVLQVPDGRTEFRCRSMSSEMRAAAGHQSDGKTGWVSVSHSDNPRKDFFHFHLFSWMPLWPPVQIIPTNLFRHLFVHKQRNVGSHDVRIHQEKRKRKKLESRVFACMLYLLIFFYFCQFCFSCLQGGLLGTGWRNRPCVPLLWRACQVFRNGPSPF